MKARVLTPFLSENVGNVFLCITEALKESGGNKIISGPNMYHDKMYMESLVACDKFEDFRTFVRHRYPECLVLTENDPLNVDLPVSK